MLSVNCLLSVELGIIFFIFPLVSFNYAEIERSRDSQLPPSRTTSPHCP
ncbi:MAG: hypothetical protein PUP90_27200 [Nostoc sp. S4]|nr:hypothetical protein [Nostoc sp. S4]